MLSAALGPAIITYCNFNLDGVEICDSKTEGEEKSKEKEKNIEPKIVQGLMTISILRELIDSTDLKYSIHSWSNHIPNINTPPPEHS